jgi:hypothetical protein
MEDAQQVIIPTLPRAKISNNLSYPIGAEQISATLAATPQLQKIGHIPLCGDALDPSDCYRETLTTSK